MSLRVRDTFWKTDWRLLLRPSNIALVRTSVRAAVLGRRWGASTSGVPRPEKHAFLACCFGQCRGGSVYNASASLPRTLNVKDALGEAREQPSLERAARGSSMWLEDGPEARAELGTLLAALDAALCGKAQDSMAQDVLTRVFVTSQWEMNANCLGLPGAPGKTPAISGGQCGCM